MDYKEQFIKLLKTDFWNGWYYFLFFLWIFAILIISIATISFLAFLNQFYLIPETNLNFIIYGFDLISKLENTFMIYLAIAVIIEVYLWFDERRMNKEKQEKST